MIKPKRSGSLHLHNSNFLLQGEIYMSKKILAGLVMAAVSFPMLAQAQTANPIISVDMDKVIATSVAGQDINNKLKSIRATMASELNTDGASLSAEGKRLESTPEAAQQTKQFEQQREAYESRAKALAQKSVKFDQQLAATRSQALDKLQSSMEPVVKSLVAKKGATMLVDERFVLYAVPGVDVTDELINNMNASIKTIPVTRVTN